MVLSIIGAIEKQKKNLFSAKVQDEAKPLVAMVWEYFVIGMIVYFVISIINSLTQNYLQEEYDQQKKIQKKTNKKQKKEV